VEEPTKEAPRPEEKSGAAATTSGPFRDCDVCPQMVPVPAGAFMLGSPDNEPQRQPYEGPQQPVTLAAFAIGAGEVTFAQWQACVADGGCGGYTPADKGWGGGDRPVMSVSWRDATAYVEWLSRKTGRAYRLPSEAEWEYAARGGATTAYWWGASYDPSRTPMGKTAEVTSDEANSFGLHHVAGNVREWVQDCYVSGFSAANQSGAPIATGNCNLRVVRGGDYRGRAANLRIANRGRNPMNTRDSTVGFRVAAAL
jgi:formylglycine-generating enzyme required for sulfatase activity